MHLPTQHLDPALPLPAYARDDDAGADLRSTTTVTLAPGERALVPTGVAVAIPTGYAGFLHPRSGLAARLGLQVVRELLVLARPVGPGDEIDPQLPDGIRHRTFRPGEDDAALLAVNAAAFAHHPEQGSLDADGLAERAAQPWFDPEGLILLEDDDPSRLVGFHWTKIDPPGGHVGEVYVVGVHPDCQGRGLAVASAVLAVVALRIAGFAATSAAEGVVFARPRSPVSR